MSKRIGIITNHWGWSLRGIRLWIGAWAWPIDVWGVERTAEREHVYRDGQRLLVFERRVKVGPICFAFGHYTEGWVNGGPTNYDSAGVRRVRYPHGRLEHWRRQRRNARIDRDNRRRADERAMREGCS